MSVSSDSLSVYSSESAYDNSVTGVMNNLIRDVKDFVIMVDTLAMDGNFEDIDTQYDWVDINFYSDFVSENREFLVEHGLENYTEAMDLIELLVEP